MGKEDKKKDKGASGGLRDKYKPAKIDSLKKQKDEENSQMGYANQGDYLDMEEGTNKFRLFPAHEGTEFLVMRKRYWLGIPDDDGEVKRRTVYDSILHGGTKKDIVQEYVKFAQKKIKDKAKLDKLTDWKEGLTASTDWLGYALKLKKDERKFGVAEFKKTVRDAINKAMFIEDADDPIEVDPYTDPDSGLPILVEYNPKPNKKKKEEYYSFSTAKKSIALTDEELETFDNAKPLTELLRNVYMVKDFDKAVEGLRHYDEDMELDLFDDEDWLEIMKDVKGQYDEDEGDTEAKSEKKKSKKEDKPEKKEDKKPKKEEKTEKEEKLKKDKKAKTEEPEEKPKKDKKSKDEPVEEEKPKKKSGMSVEEIREQLKNKKK